MRFAFVTALLAGLALAGLALPAAAEVTLIQSTSGRAGFIDLNGETIIRIKGSKMRVDYTHGGETSIGIIDIDTERFISLDPGSKRARVSALTDLEGAADHAGIGQPKVKLTPTAQTRKVAGFSCKIHKLSATLPFSPAGQDLRLTAVLTGPTCLSKGAPGYAEYASFFRAAADKGVIFGESGEKARPIAARARGVVSLLRALADGGIALDHEYAVRFQGPEPMASLMNEMARETFTNTVTRIETAEVPAELFEIPEGFEVER